MSDDYVCEFNFHHFANLEVVTIERNFLNDVSLIGMQKIYYVDLAFGNISYFDIKNCPMLQTIDIKANNINSYLNPDDDIIIENVPELSFLDVSFNDVSNIYTVTLSLYLFSNLTTFYAEDCNINSDIDAHDMNKLKFMDLKYNDIKTIDIGGCTSLNTLSIAGGEFEVLDLSTNTSLTNLWIENTGLKTLDLTTNAKMDKLYFIDGPLNSITWPTVNKISELLIIDTALQNLDISADNDLYILDIEQNALLQTITLPNNNLLTRLNQITIGNFSGNFVQGGVMNEVNFANVQKLWHCYLFDLPNLAKVTLPNTYASPFMEGHLNQLTFWNCPLLNVNASISDPDSTLWTDTGTLLGLPKLYKYLVDGSVIYHGGCKITLNAPSTVNDSFKNDTSDYFHWIIDV